MNIGDRVQIKPHLIIGNQPYIGTIRKLFTIKDKMYCKIDWDDEFTSNIDITELNEIKPNYNNLW